MSRAQRSLSGKTRALIQRALSGLPRQVLAGRRRAVAPRAGGDASRMHFEALEPRLLMSADLLPVPLASVQPGAVQSLSFEFSTAAASQATSQLADIGLTPASAWVGSFDPDNFSSTLTPLAPSGSFVHAGGVSGTIDTEGGSDSLGLRVQGEQSVALRFASTDGGLQARLEAWLDPDDGSAAQLLGFAEAGQPGEALNLQVAMPATGTLRTEVIGLSGTGAYTVELFLGAGLETVDSVDADSAMDLDPLVTALPGGVDGRAAVIGGLRGGVGDRVLAERLFDSESVGPGWSFNTFGGSYWYLGSGLDGGLALATGANSDSESNLFTATLRVDLAQAGGEGLMLDFDQRGSDTAREVFSGAPFNGDEYADGVAISVDNLLWVPVSDAGATEAWDFEHHQLDLGAALARWGLEPQGELYIRFQHANTGVLQENGEGGVWYQTGDRAWDNIVVSQAGSQRWRAPAAVEAGAGVQGDTAVLLDGVTPHDGADASNAQVAVVLAQAGEAGGLSFDMGSVQRLGGLGLSLGGGVSYRVQTSLDGLEWADWLSADAGIEAPMGTLVEVQRLEGDGLVPVQARYLRLFMSEGTEGFGAVGEFAVLTGAPEAVDGSDWYAVTLDEGDSISLSLGLSPDLQQLGAGDASLALYDASGQLLTYGVPGGAGSVASISDFRAAVAGVYRVQVAGSFSGEYQLALTRDALLAGALPLGSDITALPAVATHVETGGSGGDGQIRIAVHQDAGNGVVALLNQQTQLGFSAVSVAGGDIDTLAELSAYDVVIIGNHSYQGDYDSFATALRSWVEAGGGLVATGWTVYGGGTATGNAVADLDAVVPVQLGYYSYNYNPQVVLTGAVHPVTDGLSDFSVSGMYVESSSTGIDPGATVLATANGSAAVVVDEYGPGRGVYLGPTYFYGTPPSGALAQLMTQAVAWAAGEQSQRYQVRAQAGDSLVIEALPAGLADAAPVNDAQIHLSLLDAEGQVLAESSSGRLEHVVAADGEYTLVLAADGGSGDLLLRVGGSTAAASLPMQVLTSSLDGLTRTSQHPDIVELQFDAPLLLSSVNAEALTINGRPALGVEVLGVDRLRFHIAPVDVVTVEGGEIASTALVGAQALAEDGVYTLRLAAGALSDIHGNPVAAWSHSFELDTTLPVVTASSLAQLSVVDAGPMLVQIDFSEALNAVVLGSSDVVLTNTDTGARITLTSFSLDETSRRVELGLPELAEGRYRLTLLSGGDAFSDLLGLPLNGGPADPLPSGQGDNSPDDFVLDFIVDHAPQVLGDLPALGLPGSLVYGKSVQTDLSGPSDVDEYLVSLDAGQQFSVALDPVSPGGALALQLSLVDSGGTVVAQATGAAGEGLLLQLLSSEAALPAGDYTLRVGALAGAGGVRLTAVLGAQFEAETVAGGAGNDTPQQAVDLSASLVSLGQGGSRAAVVGSRSTTLGAESGDDHYRIALTQGQQLSAALAWASQASAGSLALDLLRADGTLLASSESGQTALRVQPISDFVADEAGDYLLRVRGSGNGLYTLAVTRSLSFDMGLSQPGGAQDLSSTHQSLGNLGSNVLSSGSGGLRVAVHGGTSAVVTALNNSTAATISAVSVTGAQIDTLAELQTYDVVVIGSQYVQGEFSQFDAALRSWVEAGGGVVATGWTVFGAGVSTSPVRPDIDAIVPVNTSGSYGWNQGGTVTITDSAHPVTSGVGNFTLPSAYYAEYPSGGVDAGAQVLATINGRPMVVVGDKVNGRGVYLGPNLTENATMPTGALDQLFEQAVLWAGGDRNDDYLVTATAGDVLVITTSTPGDGPDQPLNTLDTGLLLLDSVGNTVAVDTNGAADGRNARLVHTVVESGTYRVRVRADGGNGAYVLTVAGATGAPLASAPVVTAVTPANGTILNTVPSTLTFQLSEGVRADSVSVDDLVLDSGGTVTAVRLLAGNRVEFSVDVPLVEGAVAYHLAEGAFVDLQGNASAAFSAGLIVDLGGAQVTTTAPGADAGAPLSSWSFGFNEAILPSSASVADVLSFTGPGGVDLRNRISSVSVAGNTLTVNFTSQFAVGEYTITIGPDLLDLAGNRMDQDRDGVAGEAVEDQFTASTVLRSPDLVPVSLTVPETANFGEGMSVTWTVRNAGTEAARASWWDRLVLSTDDVLDGSDTYLTEVSIAPGALAADTTYERTRQFTLPLQTGLRPGTYRVLLQTDVYGQQGESDDSNNVFVGGTVQIGLPPLPDLSVANVVAPVLVEAGKPITVTWTDLNAGTGATNSGWYDTVYLSSDRVLGNDIALGSLYYNNATPIVPGGALERTLQVTVPTDRTGTWYVLVLGDAFGYLNEYDNENNNLGVSDATLTAVVPTEDLTVSAVTVPENGVFGNTLNVAWTVTNQGTGPTITNWNDRIWLSRDGVLDGNDTLLANVSSSGDTPLAAGASYQRSREVALPLQSTLGAGTWQILVQTDTSNAEPETDETNNVRASNALTLALPALPDLVVSDVVVPGGLRAGDSFDLRFTLSNQGSAPVSDFSYRLLLNDTADAVSAERHLGDFQFSDTLSVGESVQITQRITLPIDRPGQWYIVAQADPDNAVYEHDREANNVAASVRVSAPLPPLPDLRVTSIIAPLDGIAGQQVPVSWTVVNEGSAAVGAGFTDTLYLSTDGGATLSTWLGNFRYEGSLAAGASLTRTQTVTLPADVAAQYTVVVFTDSDGAVYEGANEGNNQTIDNTRIATVLPPLPNLVVTAITPPTQVFSSTQTELSWVVRNTGSGATSAPSWHDEVRLSLNSVFGDDDDVVLGASANVSYLDVGESYVGHLTFSVPRGISGDYHLLVRTDSYGQVFENGAEADNTLASALVHISLTPPPDLQVQSVQAPAQAFSGQPMTLSWTVANAGDGRTLEGSWYDRVYVSMDDVFDAGDLSLGLFWHSGALNPNASYVQTQQVTLPIGQAGPRWFFVVADSQNHVYEHVWEGNNSAGDPVATQVVLTPPPDLEVESITAPASVRAGDAVSLQFTVRNFGASATAEGAWLDTVYLSRDGTLDAGDLLLDTRGHYGNLAVDGAYTVSFNANVPNTLDGSWQILVRTDSANQVFEGVASAGYDPEGNNVLAASGLLAVQQRPADLVVESVVAPAAGEAGRQISVSWSTRNAGTGSVQAGAWEDRVYVSSDAILGDDDDVLLASVNHDEALGAGAAQTSSAQITLPFSLATGRYTLYVRTDAGNTVYEATAGEANNTSATSTVDVVRVLPDLVATELSLTLPDTAAGRATVHWRVDNLGANRTDSNYWTDAVYLSRDAALGSGDLLLGQVSRSNALEAGQSYAVDTSFALPAGLGSGEYFVILRTDTAGRVTEGSEGESNNVLVMSGGAQGVPVAITVPPAIVPAVPDIDLQVTAVDADAVAISGQQLAVNWTVTNLGADATGARGWYDAVYLSRDLVFDRSSDLYLGYRDHAGGLAAGASYNANASFSVPLGQSGPFYVFVVTDRGTQVAEVAEGNNSGFDSSFTQVSLAPPADLVVGEITVPVTGNPGVQGSITYSVSNLGSNPALGSWRDTIYLSADEVWDIGDTVFGAATVYGPLNGGSSYSRTVTAAMPGVTPGQYHVIVRSDILNAVPEISNANNLAASLDAVALDVQTLALGTTLQGTLAAGQSLFYKVVVGAGETVRVTLDGAGEDNGNELYLRYGSMPTRGRFDTAGKEPFVADQTAVIPTTEAGTYYVMLYGASGGARAFSLLAESLPFSLSGSDQHEIGDAGEVTLRVDGARLHDGDRFRLVNAAGERIDASAVVVASGSVAYVTFDARGATLGDWTLQAEDAQGTVATLAQTLTVTPGEGASVVVRFDGPAQVRPGRVVLANVVYANQGDADTMAPLLIVSSPTGTEFGSTADTIGLSSSVQLLGIAPQGDSSVLRPGDEASLPMLFRTVNAPMRFTVKAWEATSEVALDFEVLKRSLRTPGLTDTEWDLRWATQLQPRLGQTWGDYVRLVNQLSQRFSTPDHPLSDVRQLFQLAFTADADFLPSMVYTGTLLDADSGAALAGVDVAVYRNQGDDAVYAGSTRTDADGRFTVRGLQPGSYRLMLARSVPAEDGGSTLEYPYVFDMNRNGVADAASPGFTVVADTDVTGGSLYARARPQEVTPAHVDAQAAVATDSQGRVHMVWMRDGVFWHAINDGSGWRDAQPLPGEVSGDGLQLAADPRLVDGSSEGLLATWRQGDGNAAEVYYSVGAQQADGSWQWTAAAKLTDNSQFDGAYAIGVDADGKPQLLVQRKDATVAGDDVDLYGSEFSVQDPEFVSALAERTQALVEWLETQSDDELEAMGIHRVRFSKSIGNVNIPLIGSVKSEIRIDFQAQIDCTLIYRGNGAFKFDMNVKGTKVEIEGRAGGDVRYEVDKDTCAYVFKSARINGQVAGAVNFPLTWIPFVGPALTAIGVQGRFEVAAGGNLIWDAGASFPGWWSRGQGTFRGSLGFNWEGSIPWTGLEAVVRGLVNVNGKWDNQGLGLRDPALSGSILVRVKHGWFFGGSGWSEYTYSFPGSDLGSTGIDGELLSQDALFSGSLYDTDVSFGFDPAAAGSLNSYAGAGEQALTANLGTEGDPVIAESPAGVLWAAWSDADGVHVAQNVQGSWQSPTLIAGSGGAAVRSLALAFDGSGRAVALWNRLDVSTLGTGSSSAEIQAVLEQGGDLVSATMATDGTWSAPVALTALAGEEQQTQLLRLSNGQVLAVWLQRDAALDAYRPTLTVMSALWDAGSASWGAVTEVAEGLVEGGLRLAAQADGRAMLVWAEAVNSSNATVLRTASRAADGTWSTAGDAVISISESLLAVSQALYGDSTADDSSAPIQLEDSWYLPSPPEDCCDDDEDPPPYDPQPVVPRDPNDILGPEGFGEERWITATDTLAYTIRFENAADAAAPAQEVVVTQQLDADLDWRSFRVDDFGFGDQRIQLDGKSAFYSQRLDYSATRGYMLDVSAAIDVSTGVVTWKLTTIDAGTGEVPLDAQLGFLPPNRDENGVKDGRGEGYLSYTVRAKRNVPTGTVIDASARIVFDTEEPIDTPPIFNTLDAALPTSAVTALPGQTETPEFSVSWTGADVEGGSAVASFTIYVSTNGGEYEAWLSDTTLTEAIFTGEAGNHYAFYSVARDHAGNTEAVPEQADTSTQVAAGRGSVAGTVWDDLDGDGTHDAGEAGRAGWTVFLDSNDDGMLDEGERVTVTDADGGYRFDEVVAGDVVVAQRLDAGWLATAPTIGRQPVTVQADQTTAAVDFGVFQLGTLGGVAFDDLNANGLRDQGEALLAGITVQLDRHADGSTDASVVTGEDGRWQFTGLTAGSHRVTSLVPADRLGTGPQDASHTVAVLSGLARADLDFASVLAASLGGTAYEDLDGNGQRDAGEAGLAGWTLFLDLNGNGLLDTGERSTVSAADGSWRIDALLPGSYSVAQQPRSGWLQTAPGLGGASVSTGSLTLTGSTQALQSPDAGLLQAAAGSGTTGSNRAAQQLIGLDALRADSRFAGLDGQGQTVVLIDTGIDLDHGFFGPDADHDGVADRIVYQWDFANGDADASDRSGHGSNIASLVGAADGLYGGAYDGIASGADLIALKVFQDDGRGYFAYLENALRWVVDNADHYGVGVVNLSLGDGGNWNTAIARFGLGDELAALAAKNIIVTAAAGNSFARFGGAWGVSYPAADPAVLAVGATWSTGSGPNWTFSGGATDYTTAPDSIASFSQRDPRLLDGFAPGTGLVGAGANGGLTTMYGTSQASAMMAGVATLAQELALQTLGRRLSLAEFDALLDATATRIVDGDDEQDNVRNSGLTFGRVNALALAEGILALQAAGGSGGGGTAPGTGGGNAPSQPGTAAPAVHSVTLSAGQQAQGLDFGNFALGRIEGQVYEDADSDGQRDGGEAGLAGVTVYLDANDNALLDEGEARVATDDQGGWQFSGIGPGTHSVRLLASDAYANVLGKTALTMRSGATLQAELSANTRPTLAPVADVQVTEGSTVTLALAGSDRGGDTLHYSLVGDLPGGVRLDADTGVFTWLAADGNATQAFTVRVTDSAGSVAERSFTVQVDDVAPTLQLAGAAAVMAGDDYRLQLSVQDPGQDSLREWVIDWGDGIVQTLGGASTEAVHRYAQPGRYAVRAVASDEDGSWEVAGPTVEVSPAVLQVSRFDATATGFAVRFNRAIDASPLNLTSAADRPMGASDIVFTDAAGKVVAGSVVVDADRQGLRFVRTGGVLAAGTYSVRLASGAQAFVDLSGGALDGNGDGQRGDAYTTAFSVSGGGAVLGLGEVVRGPGQAVNLPVQDSGLPVMLSGAAGATRISFTLRFDPALITFVGASNGTGLPAGSTLDVDLSLPGEVRVRIGTGSPLGAGALELVRLQAGVPAGARYGAAQVLDLSDVLINDGAIAVRDDDGLHVAAYLGDTNGDGSYGSADVTRLQRVVARADTGFSAYPLVDALIVGDVNGSGTLTSLDAARLQQQVLGQPRPELPPIPAAGTGVLDAFLAPLGAGGAGRVNLAGTLAGEASTGSQDSWVSQWLSPAASGGSVAVKVKAGPSLIKLTPRL